MTATWKVIGIVLILGSGCLSAHRFQKVQRQQLCVLDAWLELLFYIREQIDCFLTPQGELLKHADPCLLQRCVGNTEAVPHQLPALLACAAPYLSAESYRLLHTFLSELGSSYREIQVKRCDRYSAELEQLREQTASEISKKLRTGIALRICGAMGIAVMLW